jgi:phosphoribosylanthranilate isomerase
MIVQIYGITHPDDARLVAASGADNAGVVLDEGFGTWDGVDAPTARAIVRELAGVNVVALSLATDADAIMRTMDVVTPDIAHLVRVTEAWHPDDVATLRERLGDIGVMLTIGVRDAGAVDVARRFAGVCDFFLLDTAHPETGVVGATGVTHDWAINRELVDAVDVPVVLAGGLGPDNVVAAIEVVGPAGVDSETRTSRDDDRRRKDPQRVHDFVQRSRHASVGGK